jgi:nitrite reductase/ring-hydroxylating ferredoxin subunit
MAKRIKIAGTQDVPPGKAAAFDVEGRRIALFNIEGSYYAIDDTCTHEGGPLCEGEVRGFKVTCPWHGADFDLKSGEALCAHRLLKRFSLTKLWLKETTFRSKLISDVNRNC